MDNTNHAPAMPDATGDARPAVGQAVISPTALAAFIAPYLGAVLSHPTVKIALATMVAEAIKPRSKLSDLDERAAAAVVGTSLATFKRAKIEADYFVGTRPRWRDSESVRAKFAARGSSPTTPTAATPRRGDDVDVSDVLSRSSLRAIRGGRGR